ncbi:WXG100 family type VII secretion target [Actinoplanes subglobosus]|uniref:WXG100 family type VII secretion target n=1 Tax=Actinoplanes subglobosus TaxID=1547892 RepID=A0ABV8IXU5_9ACTN
MEADEVRVDPLILETAARVCGGLRDRVGQGARDVGPATETAMSGLPGWETRAALESLLDAWTGDATRFGRYLEALGDALAGCARDYRYTDHANADLFDIRGR